MSQDSNQFLIDLEDLLKKASENDLYGLLGVPENAISDDITTALAKLQAIYPTTAPTEAATAADILTNIDTPMNTDSTTFAATDDVEEMTVPNSREAAIEAAENAPEVDMTIEMITHNKKKVSEALAVAAETLQNPESRFKYDKDLLARKKELQEQKQRELCSLNSNLIDKERNLKLLAESKKQNPTKLQKAQEEAESAKDALSQTQDTIKTPIDPKIVEALTALRQTEEIWVEEKDAAVSKLKKEKAALDTDTQRLSVTTANVLTDIAKLNDGISARTEAIVKLQKNVDNYQKVEKEKIEAEDKAFLERNDWDMLTTTEINTAITQRNQKVKPKPEKSGWLKAFTAPKPAITPYIPNAKKQDKSKDPPGV